MKNLKTLALALSVVFSVATTSAQTKKIDTSKSTINWVGKKVTGEHSGTVNFKDGAVVLKGTKLVGGTFTVDMTSMTATDLQGQSQGKLNGHLKSEDFFGTEKYPDATLVIKKIGTKATNIYSVVADLTIKGITKPVSFDMTVNGTTATSAFKVDRTKYDIKYNSASIFSTIGDKAISDEFELAIALKF